MSMKAVDRSTVGFNIGDDIASPVVCGVPAGEVVVIYKSHRGSQATGCWEGNEAKVPSGFVLLRYATQGICMHVQAQRWMPTSIVGRPGKSRQVFAGQCPASVMHAA